jgi:hypothetical protein
MPISFGTAFGLGWQLEGLWLGVALALGLVAAIEGWFLVKTDWQGAVEVRLRSAFPLKVDGDITNNYYRQHKIAMQRDDLIIFSHMDE